MTSPSPPKQYNAVLIEDGWSVGDECKSANTKAEGFDLDAVSLYDENNTLVGHADKVFGTPQVAGDNRCGYANAASNIEEAKGAPNADHEVTSEPI